MKKIFLVIAALTFSSSAFSEQVTWEDKATGGTFSAADANNVKAAVNSKQDAMGTDDNYVTDAEKTRLGNLEATDSVSFGSVTATGSGGLVSGVANSQQGSLILYSDQDIYSAGILPAAIPTGAFVWRVPPAACGGSNYLLNIDADGTGGCTDPASLGGYTNLTSFIAQTAWRIFYSDGSGDVKELALGSDGEYLKSNGTTSIPSWATPSGAAHDAVTLSADLGNNLLGLSTQVISLDNQAANIVFAGPTTGAAAAPTFRSLVDADIPSAIARDTEIIAAPTDATISTSAVATNDASTSKHGWLMMATAPDAGLRNILAIDNAETGYKNAALFDATSPSTQAFGDSAAVGSAMTAARRDHKHAMPATQISDTAYDATTWDAVTTAAPTKNAVRDYLESKLPSGSDGTYGLLLANNTTRTPTATSYELYPDGGVWKANTNGTENTIAIGPLAGQVSFTGPTTARAYALPDAAATILYSGGALGTPSGGTLTNATGLPIAGVTGWGTGIATALAINTGSAGAPVLFNGAAGTPSSLNLTNALVNSGTSLPGTCTTGALFLDTDADTNGQLYSCVATNTWKDVDDDGGAGGMATTDIDTSSELATILTDEVGTGYSVFNTAPTFVTSVAPTTADGATIGTAALEWSDIYLAAGGVINGENGQENKITSSATGWNFNLPIGNYQANDPDVAAEGKMGWDANGDWLRIHDGTNQVAVARKLECYDATVVKPNDLADATRDAFRMWQNNSGMSFVVTSWTAQSAADNTDLNIETTTNTGGTNATVDAVSIATDGTGLYYASDATITAGTITTGSIIWLDFDDTDDPGWVSVSVCGYYNGDVN